MVSLDFASLLSPSLNRVPSSPSFISRCSMAPLKWRVRGMDVLLFTFALVCLLSTSWLYWTVHPQQLQWMWSGLKTLGADDSPLSSSPFPPPIISLSTPSFLPPLRSNFSLSFSRVRCSWNVGSRVNKGEPVFSVCVNISDSDADADSRRKGEVRTDLPMQANTDDPLTGGAVFHIQHSHWGHMGEVEVHHENCNPKKVSDTSEDATLRDYMEREWGPTMLQVFVIGAEFHAPFMYHIAVDHHNSTLHPCLYRLLYSVTTSGWYDLIVQWLHTDYHHFLAHQPLWARNQYGQLYSTHLHLTATPITISVPANPLNATIYHTTSQSVGEFEMMALPDAYTSNIYQNLSFHRQQGRQPQGLGRWIRRGLSNASFRFTPSPLPTHRSASLPSPLSIPYSLPWWPFPGYRQDMAVQYGRDMTNLRSLLKPFRDCWYADIDDYVYVPYLYTLLAARQLTVRAQLEYEKAAVRALDYHPSVKRLSSQSFDLCFAQLHVTFVGDSHSRQMFNTFVHKALNNTHFSAVKLPANSRVVPGVQDTRENVSYSKARRRLLVWGEEDDAILPFSGQAQPLANYSTWQCVSKGSDWEKAVTTHPYVVADSCVYQYGWPNASSRIVQQALVESDVVFFNFGHWAAAIDPSHWPVMDLHHLSSYFNSFFTLWQAMNLTADMHKRQIQRWDETHTHLPTGNTTVNPFMKRLGELTMLDVVREKMLWWVSQTYTSHFEAHFFKGSDGRTPARLKAYAEVQRAVAYRWGIRQYSDTRHVALPFRNCVTDDDFGHIIQPIYEVQLAGMLDKVAQVRGCKR